MNPIQSLESAIQAPVRTPDAFAERLMTLYNNGAVTVMIAIGHRLGLFDVMATLSPETSEEIAHRAGLAERYVREWLAAMTTGGIVDYDPDSGKYRLDPAHAACLTRAAAPNNLAVTSQFIPFLGRMQEPILDCFKTGEGLPYSAYPCFHQMMAEDSGQTVVAALFDAILPLVPGLVERLEAGIDVLDAGCGAGHALLAMAQAYPRSRFTGYDLCPDAFAATQHRAADLGLDNLCFEARDLSSFPMHDRYDFIATFDAVHDQADPAALLAGIAGALKAGGVYLMQDIAGSSHLEKNLDHPGAPLLYSISCVHCTPVSLAQGGPGLGTMWGEELALEMLQSAGFSQIDSRHLAHDPFNVYFISRVGARHA